jgi:hypothetical protein
MDDLGGNPPYFDISATPTTVVVALNNFAGKFSERVTIFRRGDFNGKVNKEFWFAEREDDHGNRLDVFQVVGSLFNATMLAMTKIMELWESSLVAEDLERFIAMERAYQILGLDSEDFTKLRAKLLETV